LIVVLFEFYNVSFVGVMVVFLGKKREKNPENWEKNEVSKVLYETYKFYS